VLRVLANLLGLPGFDLESSQDVLKQIAGAEASQVPAASLSNQIEASIRLSGVSDAVPVVASIYQLDSLVRRSTPLQMTTDGRLAAAAEEAAEEQVAA
jgi:NADH-quinone oxidoreductase subunit G